MADAVNARANTLGIEGIEYVEYSTSEPGAFSAALELLGFRAVARHRSREILHFRAGGMNVIVNAHSANTSEHGGTQLTAFALRVRDASAAYAYCVARGAWPIDAHAGAMELNIPGIAGVGNSTIYFVDRFDEFEIYDVDFKPIAGVECRPAAIVGMHFFGIVQTIGVDRGQEWADFYRELFEFNVLPQGQYFGVLPKGLLLESPCSKFYLQLVEPPEPSADVEWSEQLTRVGFGAPDISVLVERLSARGVKFVESSQVHTSERGAVCYLGGTSFEFVRSHLEVA
jgi:4-hydroxyphenylpyruvate dioxygenase